MVLAPVAGQRRLTVDHLTAFEEITEAIHPVVVQRVGIECGLPMAKHHITTRLCQLVVAVVIGIFAHQAQRVALHHPDMPEGLEGVGLLIEMGTVAIQVGSDVTEVYTTYKNLSSISTILVEVQFVRMYQIDTFVLLHRLRLLARSALLDGLHGKHHQQQHKTYDD